MWGIWFSPNSRRPNRLKSSLSSSSSFLYTSSFLYFTPYSLQPLSRDSSIPPCRNPCYYKNTFISIEEKYSGSVYFKIKILKMKLNVYSFPNRLSYYFTFFNTIYRVLLFYFIWTWLVVITNMASFKWFFILLISSYFLFLI